MYDYAEVYDTGTTPDVLASLALYRQGLKQFETEPLHVRMPASGREGALPVRIEMPLASLKAGSYECQLNLIDPAGGNFAFSRVPLLLVR